jgi:hypothetical protein
MGDKSKGKGDPGVGTCIVENRTKLWKALGALEHCMAGSDRGGGVCWRVNDECTSVRENEAAVENYPDF